MRHWLREFPEVDDRFINEHVAPVEALYEQRADSDVKPSGIPINIRPPFRFEAGHDSNQLPAGFRH